MGVRRQQPCSMTRTAPPIEVLATFQRTFPPALCTIPLGLGSRVSRRATCSFRRRAKPAAMRRGKMMPL